MIIYTTLGSMAADIISSFIKNAFWLIVGYFLFRLLERTITNNTTRIIKEFPKWLEQYDKMKMKHYRVDRALGMRRNLS